MAIPLAQGFIRGFLGHYKCPVHRLWVQLFEARGWGGTKVDPGAKMFANKMLFIASAAALTLALVDSSLWPIPCLLIMALTTLDWAIGFCAACSVYGLWYRSFPPKA